MKKRFMKNRPGKLCLIILIAVLFSVIPSLAVSQTVESAREKYESGDYQGALQELRLLLDDDAENLEAQSLLGEVERAMRQEQALKLKNLALVEINNRRFEEAYAYLEQALLLDPENNEARELYLSIHEVLQIEGESMEEMLERQQEEMTAIGEEIPEEPVGIPVEVPVEEPEMAEVEAEPEQEAAVIAETEPVSEEEIPRYDQIFIRGGLVFTFANSNNLDYVDSSVAMLGLHIDGRYYFKFWERRLGLSLDYIGDFLKLGGSEYVNIGTHRLNASVRIRTYFFERDYGRLIVGGRLNYQVFALNNRENLGVYNFTTVYGPSIGLFIEDPVLYRFWKKPFLKSFGMESEFNQLFIFGKDDDAPSTTEWYIGAYYDLKRYRFHTGYRFYRIRNDAVKETYNDIELGAGYRF